MDAAIKTGAALITGAGSGIGRAISIRFAREGCQKLLLVDLSQDNLEETKRMIEAESKPVNVVLQVADIADSAAVQSMITACVQHFGRLDFAINNAGIALGGIKTAAMSLEMFDKTCHVNERGNFLCQKYAIEQFLKQEPLPTFDSVVFKDRNVRGVIVNTASISGLITLRDFAAYASSKHAVAILTKQLAREYAPFKIRVNSVCPGIVNTPGVAATGLTPEFEAGLSRQAPMNRWIHGDEIGEAVVFLCSSRASAITGVNLPVDCGATLYHVV